MLVPPIFHLGVPCYLEAGSLDTLLHQAQRSIPYILGVPSLVDHDGLLPMLDGPSCLSSHSFLCTSAVLVCVFSLLQFFFFLVL